MNTDRGLLELAARTLGVKWKWVGGDESGVLYVLRESAPKGDWHEWNPIRDDGDALRLAVKLRIRLADFQDTVVPSCAVCWRDGPAQCSLWEPAGDDPCAATRRAIVRAAAEIGRGMK